MVCYLCYHLGLYLRSPANYGRTLPIPLATPVSSIKEKTLQSFCPVSYDWGMCSVMVSGYYDALWKMGCCSGKRLFSLLLAFGLLGHAPPAASTGLSNQAGLGKFSPADAGSAVGESALTWCPECCGEGSAAFLRKPRPLLLAVVSRHPPALSAGLTQPIPVTGLSSSLRSVDYCLNLHRGFNSIEFLPLLHQCAAAVCKAGCQRQLGAGVVLCQPGITLGWKLVQK